MKKDARGLLLILEPRLLLRWLENLYMRWLQFSDDFNIMFLDGAGWHKSNDLRVPENIRLVFLPPYSPELNPAESVWEHLRENSFGNRPFETLDEVEEVLCAGLKKLHDNPLIVKSLTCYKWINTISLISN